MVAFGSSVELPEHSETTAEEGHLCDLLFAAISSDLGVQGAGSQSKKGSYQRTPCEPC